VSLPGIWSVKDCCRGFSKGVRVLRGRAGKRCRTREGREKKGRTLHVKVKRRKKEWTTGWSGEVNDTGKKRRLHSSINPADLWRRKVGGKCANAKGGRRKREIETQRKERESGCWRRNLISGEKIRRDQEAGTERSGWRNSRNELERSSWKTEVARGGSPWTHSWKIFGGLKGRGGPL